jgi:malonyl-CoA decarboxylase
VTLSPVTSFARWLKRERAEENSAALSEGDKAALALTDQPGWWRNEDTAAEVKDSIMRAAAWYYLRARNDRGTPVDAVARFHLGNGARLERINWLADTSDRAMEQADGLMVNYLYDVDEIERNHEAYAEGRTVVASGSVQRLLRPPLELVPIAG